GVCKIKDDAAPQSLSHKAPHNEVGSELHTDEGVARLLLPPDEQLAEAFPTFTESGGHFSVPAGPAPRRRARRPRRQGQGTCERVSYASPFVRYFPRFEGPYRRRRPGDQGASYDVPGVIWSRVGGCNPSRHGCSYHRMAVVGRAAGARQSCDRGGTAGHVHVRRRTAPRALAPALESR